MPVDIEAMLARELREVAETLDVPPVPRLDPEAARRPARRHQAWLAAAAVVAVVAGVVGVATTLDNDRGSGPAQPSRPTSSSTPSSTPSADIPRSAPEVAAVVDGALLVSGRQVPGDWWMARPAGGAWLGFKQDGSWWWGRGTDAHELPTGQDAVPEISPNGRYVAVVDMENGDAVLTLVDTTTGKPAAGTPVDIGATRRGSAAQVVAALDDGRVVIRADQVFLLRTPSSGDVTIDLSTTAPGQVVEGATPAGLVVTDGDSGQPYLADLTDTGTIVRSGTLPAHDDLVVSPGPRWMSWTPAGTTGGEVTEVGSLQVAPVKGGDPATLSPPDGWQFVVRSYAWEDDEYLVSTVRSTDGGTERLARCSAEQDRCVLVDRG